MKIDIDSDKAAKHSREYKVIRSVLVENMPKPVLERDEHTDELYHVYHIK